ALSATSLAFLNHRLVHCYPCQFHWVYHEPSRASGRKNYAPPYIILWHLLPAFSAVLDAAVRTKIHSRWNFSATPWTL
ncbi:MAG: hypothetical protein AB1476_05800, partial [Candidatus Hadarchaeota archaeon]